MTRSRGRPVARNPLTTIVCDHNLISRLLRYLMVEDAALDVISDEPKTCHNSYPSACFGKGVCGVSEYVDVDMYRAINMPHAPLIQDGHKHTDTGHSLPDFYLQNTCKFAAKLVLQRYAVMLKAVILRLVASDSEVTGEHPLEGEVSREDTCNKEAFLCILDVANIPKHIGARHMRDYRSGFAGQRSRACR